ncbi:MAG: VWA domain-containing protein [Candidatus Dependentiae bacterium]|nr:VWA domain-containing protein [Candidatus Dependentiae bacterium]
MDYFLRLVHPVVLYILIPVLLLALLIRARWHKGIMYRYPLASLLKSHGKASKHPYKKIFFLCRFLVLVLLAFLIAKPQLVDSRATVNIEGIDIVLAVDVSGSMQIKDDKNDQRSRIDIAKKEAVRFINKRDNDAIGLVIFGQDALSRCPITLDKEILKTIVDELEIGIIPHEGTVLSTALITSANRLKNSKSKNKIIILLTDGEPSEGDMSPDVAIDAARKLGIKVYTVGIGNDKIQQVMHPFYGPMTMPRVNTELLTRIARETGGKFFMAKNAHDMRVIYDTIDALEKTKIEAPVFSHYWDIFIPVVWIIFGLLMFELLASSFFWFGV